MRGEPADPARPFAQLLAQLRRARALGLSGEPDERVDLLGAEYWTGDERGQDRREPITLYDGRRFWAPKCDRCLPIMFRTGGGCWYYARLTVDESGLRLQTFGSDVGAVNLVAMDLQDATFRSIADNIPLPPAPATGTVGAGAPHVPPEEGEQAAAGAGSGSGNPPAAAKPKRTRQPRQISKVQKAIIILKYRAKRPGASIRVQDIAHEAQCSAQNLYRSDEFKKELGAARARRLRRGWKVEGVADCPDESTLDGG
jgi:hypothetical protein